METSPLLSDCDNVRFRGGHQHISIAGGGGEDRRVGLVAMFVVAFDTKAGNLVEWQLPQSCDTKGVEFKALASGAHNVPDDFTYFRLGNLYGLSCYERKYIKSGGEGGGFNGGLKGGRQNGEIKNGEISSLKSNSNLGNQKQNDGEGIGGCVVVGNLVDLGDVDVREDGEGGESLGDGEVMGGQLNNLFIEANKKVGGDNGSGKSGGNCGVVMGKSEGSVGGAGVDERGGRMKSVGVVCHSYEELSGHFQFLRKQVHCLLDRPCKYEQLEAYWLENKEKEDEYVVRSVKSLHPEHTFEDFLRQYGVKVFPLWRLVMCGARILIYSSPPIGDKCFHVHCLSHLGKHHHQRSLPHHPTTHPLFYINVADIDQLKYDNYIACTTEKIFQLKENLYDVIIIEGEIVVTSPAYRSIVKVNSSDIEKYEELLSYSRMGGGWDGDDDDGGGGGEVEFFGDVNYIEFFRDLNNHILETLLENTGGEIGQSQLKTLPIHSTLDRPFILLLSEVYAIDVMVTVDNPCCPTSS